MLSLIFRHQNILLIDTLKAVFVHPSRWQLKNGFALLALKLNRIEDYLHLDVSLTL